jgi:hypothetical protein
MNTAANNNTPTAALSPNGQLFDLVQRKDGAWVVWTRKSLADLNMVDRVSIEAVRGEFTEAEWAEFLRQPHFSEPSVWIAAAVYEARPTIEAVLTLLGVKRKPRPEGAAKKPARAPRGPRPARALPLAA